MANTNGSEELFKKYLTDTVSSMLDQDSLVNVNSSKGRALPRTSPLSEEELLTNTQYAKDRASAAAAQRFARSSGGEVSFDANPNTRLSDAGKTFLGTDITNSSRMGPFFYDMNAGTFGIGGVEFDFRSLNGGTKDLNESLVLLATELLLFINDIKGSDKYKSVVDSYVSKVDTLPQTALQDVSLPVIDTSWAYPGSVYSDRTLPYSYKLKNNDEAYCGKCYNYVGSGKVGKCHRWNNAVSAYYKCNSFRNRAVSFHEGTYKGRFKSTDEGGLPIAYKKGDVVTFNSKTYVATHKTSAAVGSPLHSTAGWRLIDQDILDGGEY